MIYLFYDLLVLWFFSYKKHQTRSFYFPSLVLSYCSIDCQNDKVRNFVTRLHYLMCPFSYVAYTIFYYAVLCVTLLCYTALNLLASSLRLTAIASLFFTSSLIFTISSTSTEALLAAFDTPTALSSTALAIP